MRFVWNNRSTGIFFGAVGHLGLKISNFIFLHFSIISPRDLPQFMG